MNKNKFPHGHFSHKRHVCLKKEKRKSYHEFQSKHVFFTKTTLILNLLSLTLYSDVNVLLRKLADTDRRTQFISTFTVNLSQTASNTWQFKAVRPECDTNELWFGSVRSLMSVYNLWTKRTLFNGTIVHYDSNAFRKISDNEIKITG